tara:strand:- start:39 stop:272 length:234 start_codon:yes stop_codon:yes gene_type:complete
MTAMAEKVLGAALELTPRERADLAEKIVASIEVDMDPEIEAAQLDEVARRRQQVGSGTVELIPGDEVMRQARDIAKR